MEKSKCRLVQPSFRETEKELVYSFGGVNRESLAGTDSQASPFQQLANNMTRVELMRRAVGTDATSSAYWSPVLDGVEKIITEQIAILDGDEPVTEQRATKFGELQGQVERTLVDAIEKVAASQSRRAVPAPRSEAWPTPRYFTEYQPRSILVQVPVTLMSPRQHPVTENVTQQYTVNVPVQVPTTRTRTEYRQVPKTDVGGGYVLVPYQVEETVMVTQYRTETKTQTVPVTRMVTEMVPTTFMQTQYRTELVPVSVPRAPKKFKVTLSSNPTGADVFFLDDYNYDVFIGRQINSGRTPRDDFVSWKTSWEAFLGKERVLGEARYYLRAHWDERRLHRSHTDLRADTEMTLTPNEDSAAEKETR